MASWDRLELSPGRSGFDSRHWRMAYMGSSESSLCRMFCTCIFVELLLPDGVTEMPFGIFALLLLVFVTAPVTWTSRLFRNCAWFLFLLLRNRCSLLNNFNSGHFKYMSLWRCGIVSSCHPVGPGSIPGVGAISLCKNLLQRRTWLSRLWFHQCFVRWGWIYPLTSRNFVVTEATTFSSFTGWSKFVVL